MFEAIENKINEKKKQIEFYENAIKKANKDMESLKDCLDKLINDSNLDEYIKTQNDIRSIEAFIKDTGEKIDTIKNMPPFSRIEIEAGNAEIANKYDKKFQKIENELIAAVKKCKKPYEDYKALCAEAKEDIQHLKRYANIINDFPGGRKAEMYLQDVDDTYIFEGLEEVFNELK